MIPQGKPLSLPGARKTVLATLIVSDSLLERQTGKKEKQKLANVIMQKF